MNRQLRSVPPSGTALTSAVSRLAPGRSPMTFFHLTTPVDVATSISVTRQGSQWSFRGTTSSLPAPQAAVTLAALSWEDSDRFLDLEGEPWQWCKPIHSGSRLIVFGIDLLFDLPLLAAPIGTPDLVIEGAIKALIDGEIHPGDSFSGMSLVARTGAWALEPSPLSSVSSLI